MNGGTAVFIDDAVTLYHGDCRAVMASLGAATVDAIVTDPPYELGFMGKRWDASGIAYDAEMWQSAYRVLKPGGHLLAFGGTRTWHRLAVAIEDAGFEVRDSIAWMYGSGFPKSLDVSKAIDKKRDDSAEGAAVGAWLKSQRIAAGFKQQEVAALWPSVTGGLTGCVANWETIGKVPTWDQWLMLKEFIGFGDDMDAEVWRLNGRKGKPGEAWGEREVIGQYETDMGGLGGERLGQKGGDITAPATPAAQQWQGWGTALKPAFEPIVVARKPLDGTVAENVLTHGTGALNIDGCRIAGDVPSVPQPNIARDNYTVGGSNGRNGQMSSAPLGRWPANVILDESQAAELDRQSGVSSSAQARVAKPLQRQDNNIFGKGLGSLDPSNTHNDTGGASRFFYVPKANKRERPRDGDTAHPTVKPLALMRYLVKLVTPPGGTVLEPFAGSGTTAEACVLEGFRCIAIEMTDDYLPLIIQRLERVERGLW
jgi:DNA modification methylase